MTEARIAGKLAYAVIDAVPEVVVHENKKKVNASEVQGRLTFKNVDFIYPGRKDLVVLKGLTCSFEPGQTTALVGPSGSGKSTIIQLLERYYNPAKGEIALDG